MDTKEEIMTKRRSIIARKLRDRRSGRSPYAKYGKIPYKYGKPKEKEKQE